MIDPVADIRRLVELVRSEQHHAAIGAARNPPPPARQLQGRITPLEPCERAAVARARDRLRDAGRWDCVERIERMTNPELHVLAVAEGWQFHTLRRADPQEVA